MEWVTITSQNGKKTRHVHVKWAWHKYKDELACGRNVRYMEFLDKDDSKAPKCKNCLKVLKRLIEK